MKQVEITINELIFKNTFKFVCNSQIMFMKYSQK